MSQRSILVLQCVAVSCIVFCNVLHWNVHYVAMLQCVACCVAVCCMRYITMLEEAPNMSHRSVRMLQCAAVCCSVLQCAAVCCSVLQCVSW